MAAGDEPGDKGFVPMFDGSPSTAGKRSAAAPLTGSRATHRRGRSGVEHLPADREDLRRLHPQARPQARHPRQLGHPVPQPSAALGRRQTAECSAISARSTPPRTPSIPRPAPGRPGSTTRARRGWLYPFDGPSRGAEGVQGRRLEQVLRSWPAGRIIRTWLNGAPCADLIDSDGPRRVSSAPPGPLGQGGADPMEGRPDQGSRPDAPGSPALGRQDASGMGYDRRRSMGGSRTASSTAHPPSDEQQHGLADKATSPMTISPSGSSSRPREGEQRPLLPSARKGGNAGVLGLQAEIAPTRPMTSAASTRPAAGAGSSSPSKQNSEPSNAAARKGANKKAAPGRKEPGARPGTTSSPSSPWANGSSSSSTEGRPPRSATRKGRKSGHIALQLHGGQDMDVEFKDIEILPLDGKKCQD